MEDSGDSGEAHKGGDEARGERIERARKYFLVLARRAEANQRRLKSSPGFLGSGLLRTGNRPWKQLCRQRNLSRALRFIP